MNRRDRRRRTRNGRVPEDDPDPAHLRRGEGEGVYVGFLGFAVDWEHHFEETTPAYILVSRAGLTPHLSEHRGDARPGPTVFVWMTGIEEFHRETTGKRYKYPRPGIETTFHDSKAVEVIDPFGNRLRFNQDLKSGKATGATSS